MTDTNPTPTRRDVLDAQTERGYTGPTSFTVKVLRDVLAWMQAGSPKDQADGMSNGVLFAVHPDL